MKLAYASKGATDVKGRLWHKKLIAKKAAVAKPAERLTNQLLDKMIPGTALQ